MFAMAKLGTYSYPDIRFSDAVQIAGRILAKFRGTVGVKGLAWELGMAENSGTLFAKVAALRDFGLVEGRGELRVSDLARKIIHPANDDEGQRARIEAFQRVDLLRALYERFEGEAPDDSSLLIGLEEITKSPRDEIVRRFSLIQKHLADAARVMRRAPGRVEAEPSGATQQRFSSSAMPLIVQGPEPSMGPDTLFLVAGETRLSSQLTSESLDAAITLLQAIKARVEKASAQESTTAS